MIVKKFLLNLVIAGAALSPLFCHAQDSLSPQMPKLTSRPLVSLSMLDQLWAQRESVAGQKAILSWLQSKPDIPNSFEGAWKIARLVYFAGNFGDGTLLSGDEKQSLFLLGYQAAEVAQKLEPKRVEGYYWYAVNLGSYSLAKGMMASLDMAPLGRDALLKAIELDPSYQWGGPYRVLGRYYQNLPSFISFGDKAKARDYYNQALDLFPKFRLNLLYLARLESDSQKKQELLKQALDVPDMDGKLEEETYLKAVKAELSQG